MDALAHHYKVQSDGAVRLAQNGDEKAALDILYRFRLKLDLSLYRRAVESHSTSCGQILS